MSTTIHVPGDVGSVSGSVQLAVLESQVLQLRHTVEVLAEAISVLAEGLEMNPTESVPEHAQRTARAAALARGLVIAAQPSPAIHLNA